MRKESEAPRSMKVVSLTSSLSQNDSRGMELVLKYSSMEGTSSNQRCWMLQPVLSMVILRCWGKGGGKGGKGGKVGNDPNLNLRA